MRTQVAAAALFVVAAIHAHAVDRDAHGKIARSQQMRHAFKKLHPCPANGHRKGPCPGYVIDHVVPLCAGGPDRISNMQWQTVADAKAKDRLERVECRSASGYRVVPVTK